MLTPATLVVLLIAGLLILVGSLVIGSARPAAGRRRCPACGAHNPPAAAYCGHCGRHLVS